VLRGYKFFLCGENQGVKKQQKDEFETTGIHLAFEEIKPQPELNEHPIFRVAEKNFYESERVASYLLEGPLYQRAMEEMGKIAAEMAPKIKVPGFPRELLAKYELLEFIGEGGFAKVFKVKSKLEGKIVALKILNGEERVLETLRNEVAAWLSLDHENIVRLYGISKDPIPHLEMEFVEGIRIDGKIARDLGDLPKPVDEKIAIKLVRGIAEGLRHAHSKGVFHCDLKPQNILLSAEFKPKITDWGLAKVRALSVGVEAFTLLYAAPEHLDSKHYGSTDNRTDIFQLGLIFYELLTGRLPFDVESPYQVMGSILSSEPFPLVSKYRSELSKFDGIISKMLAKRKEERFQSVDEFISALDLLEKGSPEMEELLRRTSKKGFQI
jgi:serine/threonine protein kinase